MARRELHFMDESDLLTLSCCLFRCNRISNTDPCPRPQNCLTCPPLSQTCPPKRVNTIFRHFCDKNCVIKAFELGNDNTCMKNVHPTQLLCSFCWLWRKCLREHLYVGTSCRHYQNLMELTKIVHVAEVRNTTKGKKKTLLLV